MAPSTNTIASGAIGVPLAIVMAWVIKECCHMEMSGEVQTAMGALLSAAIGWAAESIHNRIKVRANVKNYEQSQ